MGYRNGLRRAGRELGNGYRYAGRNFVKSNDTVFNADAGNTGIENLCK